MNKPQRLAQVALVSAAAALTLGTVAQAQQAAVDRATIEAAFAKADANADGKLSKDEAVKLPAIAAKFDALDKNKDGALDLAEFAAGYSAAS